MKALFKSCMSWKRTSQREGNKMNIKMNNSLKFMKKKNQFIQCKMIDKLLMMNTFDSTQSVIKNQLKALIWIMKVKLQWKQTRY